jgi:predicted cobalt transporter CbtA
MERKLIFRGLLAGFLAGLVAFVFARIFAEPQIQLAIDYESARDAAQEALDKAAGVAVAAAGPDPFSRTVQSTIGIAVGIVVLGTVLGGMYAVAYSLAYGRVGAVKARTLAMLLALGGFLGVYLVPFLKYPANPPAIGHEETIGPRSALYLTMVGASLVFGILAVLLGRRLHRRFTTWTSTLLAAAAFVVVIGILMLALPQVGELSTNVAAYGHHPTETPLPLLDPSGAIVFPGFDADVLYRFRLYSVIAQVLLWGTIGLVFGPLAARVLEGRPARSRAGGTHSTRQTGSATSR